MATQMSKTRKFVANGGFAELTEVLTRELAEDGHSRVKVRVTPMRTEIIIRARGEGEKNKGIDVCDSFDRRLVYSMPTVGRLVYSSVYGDGDRD